MKLIASNDEQARILHAAFTNRERFTLTGVGLRADYIADTFNRAPNPIHDGFEVNVELEQVTATESTATSWRGHGDGLPPVGLEVEWKEKTGYQWVAATVLFISEKSAVLQRSDGFEWQMATGRAVFRPIRTPEQIKAEQREKDIAELLNVFPTLNGSPIAYAQAAIDAGYRKFEIVDEQP